MHRRRDAEFVGYELLIWLLAYPLYMLSRAFATSSAAAAERHADDLVSLERTLGLAFEGGLQSFVMASPVARSAFDVVYEWGFYPLLISTLVALGLLRRELYRDARRALILSLGLAVIIFVLFPTAPPRLVHGLGIHDTVGMRGHDVDSFHGIDYNPYAAMPSLHVGWSLIVARGVYQAVQLRLARALAVLHPIVMAVATIATGNHYVLDCVVGAALAMLAIELVGARRSVDRERAAGRAAPIRLPA